MIKNLQFSYLEKNSRVRLILITLLFILFSFGSKINFLYGQYSGTITVPTAGSFPTLKAAIDSLNLYGVSGAVTVNVSAGNNQTLTGTGNTGGGVLRLGSATLNASLSSTNTLTFNGNGNTITAHVGNVSPGTTVPTFTTVINQDVMWALEGTDFVTINNFTFVDPTSNTTNATAMECAIGMYNRTNTSGSMDGCQNVIVNNCTFNFQDLGANGHMIYIIPALFNATTNLNWTAES